MKTLTLRGNISLADNARTVDNEVFSYQGNFMRGWVVREFFWWPASIRGSTGSGDGQIMMNATLATDTVGALGFEEISNCVDNRFIAWSAKGYNRRNSSVDDFITGPTGVLDSRALIDPDHVVNDALYINAYSTSDSTTSPTRIMNYMIVLEEKKLSPQAAILALIKGKAQDVDN